MVVEMVENLKILKLAKYGETTGKTQEEEDALLKKNNCRRLFASEWLALPEASTRKGGEYYDYWPCRLETGGLVARYCDYFHRYVYCDYVPPARFGVLGTPLSKNPPKAVKPSDCVEVDCPNCHAKVCLLVQVKE